MNEHTRVDLVHVLAIAFILFALAMMHGCVLGPIAASQLTTDQMQALKQYNDTGDVYACFLVGGPPPAGNIVAVVVPKGAPVDVQFAQDCHAVVKTGK